MSQVQAVPKVPENSTSEALVNSPAENNANRQDETSNHTDGIRSEITDSTTQSELEPGQSLEIRFRDWGFKIERLFEVAHRFYKRNESKAFHPSFDIRNQMNALILQAKYGNFDESKIPEVGILDLVGKSRRKEWAQLEGMSKAEAMSKFICTLDEICPFFKAHAEAVKISSYGSQQINSNGSQTSMSNGPVSGSESLDGFEAEDQLKAIRTSLCRQTYHQFKSYAEQQYPDETDKQKYLIGTLQEQYFQQYISQMHPNLRAKIGISDSGTGNPASASSLGTQHETDQLSRVPDEPDSTVQVPSAEILSSRQVPAPGVQYNSSAQQFAPDYQAELENIEEQLRQRAIDTDDDDDDDDIDDVDDSEAAASPLQSSLSYEPLEAASIWMKKGVREFKESLLNDKHGGSYVVKQGTLLTIQVPTYPDGRFIHWEFATDDYDIGFGLEFLSASVLETPLSLKFHEETDEDDLDEDETNLEQVTSESPNGDHQVQYDIEAARQGRSRSERNLAATIVATYRRDSHEEVFVGRHRYPGRGYYLLKFDNTYSVLRSKTIYYRICYFV